LSDRPARARQEPPPDTAPAQVSPSEDDLHMDTFRYLDLSAPQRRQLLWAARQVEGRRSSFEREERQVEAEIRRLAESNPEAAQRLRQGLEHDREQMAGEV